MKRSKESLQRNAEFVEMYSSGRFSDMGKGSMHINWVLCDCGIKFDRSWLLRKNEFGKDFFKKYDDKNIDVSSTCAMCAWRELHK